MQINQMTEAEALLKYPTVSEYGIASLFREKARKPEFDLESWLEQAEENAVAKKSILDKYEAKLALLLGKEEAKSSEFDWEGYLISYVGSLLHYPFHNSDTQELFDEACVYAEKLACGILKKDAETMAFVAAYDAENQAHKKLNKTGERLLEHFTKKHNIDRSHPYKQQVERGYVDYMYDYADEEKLWELVEESPEYEVAVGQLAIANTRLIAAYDKWVLTAKLKKAPSKSEIPEAVKVKKFSIYTGQETDCLFRGAGDGKRGDNWRNVAERGTCIWEARGRTHWIEHSNSEESETIPFDGNALEELTKDLDIDFVLAFNYIAGVLCSPQTAGKQQNIIGAWIDLNDVMAKIGWLNRNPDPDKKEELRSKLWKFIRVGAQAKVNGKRSRKYLDPITREEIETTISSAPWQITDQYNPTDDLTDIVGTDIVVTDSLVGPTVKAAPLLVFVVISQQWQPFFEDPRLTQFYPCGELLGQIPAHKISGDWARIIGLTLAQVWRISPRETLAGTFSPTRRELLTHFTPKTKTVEELFKSKNPNRAIESYLNALDTLVEIGLIASKGDATREMNREIIIEEMLKPYGRQGWQKAWLDCQSHLFPGEVWLPFLHERKESLPPSKPRNLTAKKRR